MRKILFLSLVILSLFSCSGDDDSCECRGNFVFITSGGNTSAPNVDCDTGEPFVSQQSSANNPVSFQGCQ